MLKIPLFWALLCRNPSWLPVSRGAGQQSAGWSCRDGGPQVFVCTPTGFGCVCTTSLPGYRAGAPSSSWLLSCDQENTAVVKTWPFNKWKVWHSCKLWMVWAEWGLGDLCGIRDTNCQVWSLLSVRTQTPEDGLGAARCHPTQTGHANLLSHRARLWQRGKADSPCLWLFKRLTFLKKFFSPIFLFHQFISICSCANILPQLK